jgi:hypothetical protein
MRYSGPTPKVRPEVRLGTLSPDTTALPLTFLTLFTLLTLLYFLNPEP